MANLYGFDSIWLMNNDWTDAVGTNDGTPSGATFGSPGHPPGSTYYGLFDGVDSIVNCSNGPSLSFTNTMTAMCWYYSTNGVSEGLFYKGGASQNGDYALKTDGGKNIDVVLNDGLRLGSTTPLIQNSWNHVGFTFDKDAGSNNVKLYQNGLNIANASYASAIQTSADNFKIGRYFTSSFSYTGRLDQLAIGSVVLSPTDFSDIYNGGAGIDILAEVANGFPFFFDTGHY